MHGLLPLLSQLARALRVSKNSNAICFACAWRCIASATLQQMFVMLHHGALSMIAATDMHPDRIAMLRPGQKPYSTRLYG
jgi:hypothetical protein